MTSPDPLPRLLAPFLDHPDRAGVITDFDGTLAPIVVDPAAAVALPGAVEVLHALADRYRRVAVVSGRPVAFLIDRLGLAERPSPITLSGLYGLERARAAAVAAHPAADEWRSVVAGVADRAEVEAPEGVEVERKGLSVTLHFRRRPEHDRWARSFADAQAHVTGLAVHAGRQSFELRPPIDVDKGTVVAELGSELDAVCFLGDDLGDLPAFDALDRLAADGAATLKVGVRSPEAPPELLERADLLVDGPPGAVDLLRRLLP